MFSIKFKLLTILSVFLFLICISTVAFGVTTITATRESNNDVTLNVTDDTVNPISYGIAVTGSASPEPEQEDYSFLSTSTMQFTIQRTNPLLSGTKLYVWIKLSTGEQLCSAEEITIPASASVFSDFSNAKLETYWDSTGSPYIGHTAVKLTDATLIENNFYYIYISKTQGDVPDITDEDKWIITNRTSLLQGLSYSYAKYFELAGSTYVSIMEKAYPTYETKLQLSSQEIIRRGSDGKQIKLFFFNDDTSCFCGIDHDEINGERKVIYKIGLITDNNIIKAFKDGNSNAYSLLMQYAKNNAGIGNGILTFGTAGSTSTNPGALGSLNIQNDKMYYVYVQLDSENGKFHSIEDVDIYYGLVGSSVGKNLFDRTDNNFKYVIGDDGGDGGANYTDKKDLEELPKELPKAGQIGIAIITIIPFIIIAIANKKILNKHREK